MTPDRLAVAALAAAILVGAFPWNPLRGAGPIVFDHVHFAVPNPEIAAAWYRKHFGASPGPLPDRVFMGPTRFIFQKNEKAIPSEGSVVDHVGISVADVAATLKALEADGAKVTVPPRAVSGLFELAFVEDPWGTKLEILSDADLVGFHHVHLSVPDVESALKWYQTMFGGEANKLKGQIDGVRYGDVWLLARRGASTPSQGHSIDHIGWRPENLRDTFEELRAKGAKIRTEPRQSPFPGVSISFVEDPYGVRIEVAQRAPGTP